MTAKKKRQHFLLGFSCSFNYTMLEAKLQQINGIFIVNKGQKEKYFPSMVYTSGGDWTKKKTQKNHRYSFSSAVPGAMKMQLEYNFDVSFPTLWCSIQTD